MTQRRFSLGSLLRKKRTWFLLALIALVCGILFSFQGPRCCLYGWLRLEPTYRWLPASYWRAAILDEVSVKIPPPAPPMDFMSLARYEWARLYDRHWTLASQAGKLRRADPAMMPLILFLLEDEEYQVRWAAIGLIGLQEDAATEAVPRLIDLLDSPDYTSRLSAVFSLGRLGPLANEALPKLRAWLAKEQRVEFKLQIAFAIKQIDPEDAASMQFFLALMKPAPGEAPRNSMLARSSAAFLGLLKPPPKEALPLLVELARDTDPHVAQAAFNTLLRLDPELAKREGFLDK